MFSVSSLLFVSFKASFVFGNKASMMERGGGYAGGVEIALFACSLALAIGHIVVAYRTSCRERRKLLVYKIDIEAVSQLSLQIKFFPHFYPFLCERSNFNLGNWGINYFIRGQLINQILGRKRTH